MRSLLTILLAAASLPVAARAMEPGERQYASTMTSPILPRPQATVTQCASKEDAADPTRFTAHSPAADCQVTPGSRTSENYSWTVSCPKQGMRGEGKARFGCGTIESDMQTTMDMQGQKMDMLNRTSGRRLGPCKTK